MKTEIVPKSNTPKTKRGEDRQKKLLNTAIKVFLEHGYEGASLEKIILDAGGSRSTIYSLYGSKKGSFSGLPEKFGGGSLFRIRRTLRRVSSLGRGAHCFRKSLPDIHLG